MPENYIGLIIGAVVVGAFLLVGLGMMVILAKFYRQVEQGKALIVNTRKSEPLVTFTGAVVYPVVHRAEVMDISVKKLEIDRRGKEGLICKDNIRADINVNFFVRVNKTTEDVLKVAQSIGCARASDPTTLEQLFTAKFSEALKTAGKHFDFAALYTKRDEFKDEIIKVIGKDLNGFILDDAAIDFLEQTPLTQLDKDNIMDAEGIKKITELTVSQNVLTNDLRQKERMEIGSQNLTSDEAVFRFEQRRAEAEAKKDREIRVAQERENNEALRVANEEAEKTALAQQESRKNIEIAGQAAQRGVAVAEKNKQREVAVETERVEKARALEAISREREVELQRIAKEKELELQRKEIADVIRARVVVEKSVAEEEERTKDVRALADATRKKDVVRIGAEAAAQEGLVKQVKAAEASEEVAKFHSRERALVANADLETAEKSTRAKIRLAEGIQAEASAAGLAEVRVREADAVVAEKRGLIEARITLEKMQAVAAGEEKQGLARVRVREADALAIEKQGLAEASVTKEKLMAEAVGAEHKGLAHARVAEADAAAAEKRGLADAVSVEKRGLAEAVAVKEKLIAEAAGLAEKAVAMKALDGVGREHEEFRLRLEKDKAVALETIHSRKAIAEAQASILSQAFANAKINIVGGDGAFFDRFVKAVAVGQSIDGVVDNSDAVRTLLHEYMANNNGNGNGHGVPAAVSEILAPAALGAGGEASAQRLTISALLSRLMAGSDGDARSKLARLAASAKDLGIDELGAR